MVTLIRILVAGGAAGGVFVWLLGYRIDYAGHFLAGFGGTLGLLAVALATCRRPLRWEPVGVAVVAILVGAAFEATVFRVAILDPVDFCNQSLGAALAAVAVYRRPGSPSAAFGAGVLAVVFLILGFRFAFA